MQIRMVEAYEHSARKERLSWVRRFWLAVMLDNERFFELLMESRPPGFFVYSVQDGLNIWKKLRKSESVRHKPHDLEEPFSRSHHFATRLQTNVLPFASARDLSRIPFPRQGPVAGARTPPGLKNIIVPPFRTSVSPKLRTAAQIRQSEKSCLGALP